MADFFPIRFERTPTPSPLIGVLVPIVSILLALVAGSVVLIASGENPIDVYRAMLNGAFGDRNGFAEVLVKMTPLLLTGLGVSVAFRMQLWNIGAEGQLFMGATFATALALWFPSLPRPALLTLMVLAGAVGGAAWALGPAILRARLAVNEIITTLMLNYVAILYVDYLVHGRWADPGSLGFPLSKPFSDNATLPSFFGTRLHLGFLIAIAAAVAFWLVLRGTKWGYEIRVSGESASAARYAGMPVARNIVVVMLVSGALAGIAGMAEVSGIVHRIQPDISPGYGYTGIIVATLGRFSPIGVVLSAFLFGALQVGGYSLQTVGATASAVGVLQGAILFISLAGEILARYRIRWQPGSALPEPVAEEVAGR
jgi:simple sugar transport system permease protein